MTLVGLPVWLALAGLIWLVGYGAVHALAPVLAADRVLAETAVSVGASSAGDGLFDGAPMAPGQPVARCLAVDVTGARRGEQVVVLARSVTGELAARLRITVELGEGGGSGACTGFRDATTVYDGSLTALAATTATGTSTGWFPATAARRTFRITAEVPDDDAVQGTTAAGDFVWRLLTGSGGGSSPNPPSTPPGTGPEPTAPATGEPAPGPPSTTPGTAPEPGETGAGTTATATAGSPAPTTPGVTSTPTGPGGPGGAEGSGAPGGSGGRDGTAGGRQPGPADVSVRATTQTRLAHTALGVARHPQPALGAVFAATLFLLLQGRLDRRDPKLAGAARTRRDVEFAFPPTYGSAA
jgi:hypothetical protein